MNGRRSYAALNTFSEMNVSSPFRLSTFQLSVRSSSLLQVAKRSDEGSGPVGNCRVSWIGRDVATFSIAASAASAATTLVASKRDTSYTKILLSLESPSYRWYDSQ